MTGLDFLNLVIGLIFIYLIYSIAASTIWEIAISLTNLRANMLFKWLDENFGNLVLKENNEKISITNHPLIIGLSTKADKLPSYISSEVFVDALIDLIVAKNAKNKKPSKITIDTNSLKSALDNSGLSPGIQRIFMQYIAESSDNLQKVKEKISRWYDESQERLLGSFKKRLQVWIFLIALALVGTTNADTFRLASYLYDNPETRDAIANQVEIILNDSSFISKVHSVDTAIIDSLKGKNQDVIIRKIEKDLTSLEELNSDLLQTGLPLGWGNEFIKPPNLWDIVKKTGGLLLTVFAVSLGAPFWFDILNKIATLRSSGAKPRSTLEDKYQKKHKKKY